MVKLVLILHLLGASIWVGGHLVLVLGYLPQALRERDPQIILRFEERFERLGIPALLVQIVTGLYLAQRYLPIGEWFSFSTNLSTLISLKLVLLAVTLALAVDARARLIPRLDRRKLASLAAHIIAVTIVGVLFVVVGVGVRTGGLF